MGKRLTRDDVWWIQKLRGNGFTQAEIGNMLNISQQRVAYQLKILREELLQRYPFLNPTEE